MNIRIPALAGTLVALLIAGSLDAAVQSSGWPESGGDGLQAALLPPGEAATDLSLEPGRNADLLVAWTQGTGTLLRVQRLSDDGFQSFGTNGTIVRSGSGLGIGPAASRREGDARGPFDLFSTSDGGVIVAWTEEGILGRDLRAQRLNASGAAQWTAGGVVLMGGLALGPSTASLIADGADGVYAVSTFGGNGTGVLRFAHLRGNGTLAIPAPGTAVDTSPDNKDGASLALLGNGDVAVCWLHGGDAGLRFQMMGSAGPKLTSNGVSIATADQGFPSLLAAGSSIPGYALVGHRQGSDVRLLLVDSFGSVLRNESAGSATLVSSPDIIRSTLTQAGLPEGIEMRGINSDGNAVRFVRRVDGTFLQPQVIEPPAAATEDAAGALRGPLWVTDLGSSTTQDVGGRVLTLRGQETSEAFETLFDPELGSWLALVPGETDTVRVCGTGIWTFTGCVVMDDGDPVIVASRSGRAGAINLTGGSGLLAKTVKSKRKVGKPGSVKWNAPDALLAADTGFDGKAAEPLDFRVLVGSERGEVAELVLTGWKGKKNGSWKAVVGGDGATGSVKAGSQGRVLRATVKGLNLDPGERVAWIRIEMDDAARGAAVLLQPNKSGKTGKFKAE